MVDANVLFSALLRDGATRHLLLFAPLDLVTPATIWQEFQRNRDYLVKKSEATPEAFDLLLERMQARIGEIPLAVLRTHLKEAEKRLGPNDKLDAPYVAASIAVKGILWTQDQRLVRKAGVDAITTPQLLKELGFA